MPTEVLAVVATVMFPELVTTIPAAALLPLSPPWVSAAMQAETGFGPILFRFGSVPEASSQILPELVMRMPVVVDPVDWIASMPAVLTPLPAPALPIGAAL